MTFVLIEQNKLWAELCSNDSNGRTLFKKKQIWAVYRVTKNGQICLPLAPLKAKMFSAWKGPLTSHQGPRTAPGPIWGHRLQTPVISSRCARAIQISLEGCTPAMSRHLPLLSHGSWRLWRDVLRHCSVRLRDIRAAGAQLGRASAGPRAARHDHHGAL